jgi:cytochrome c oxidase subunit 2
MKRDIVYGGLIWIALTAIGLFFLFQIDLFPIAAAQEAHTIDDAFRFLLLLGTPVFTFVIAGLLYSIIRYRQEGDEPQDGPPIRTSRGVTWTWLAITSALAIFIIFNPGLKGIRELTADQEADLVVQVETRKWNWAFSYPQYGVTLVDAQELVLPVDRRIRFEVTSSDIIHSFWVPAFRMKVDAMPGQTNILYATPTETGSFDDDSNLRVQCAELCGTGHARMRVSLRILTQQEFEAWTIFINRVRSE